jgi:hypothetical protein
MQALTLLYSSRIEVASFATGIALAKISADELFFNEVGTTTQIATIAIPVFILLGRVLSAGCEALHRRKVTNHHPLIVPYILGALFVIAAHRFQMALPGSMCNYYDTCPNAQPHFIPECKRLVNQCEQELLGSQWHLGTHFVAHSNGGDIWYHGGWDGPFSRRKLVNWCADGSDREFAFETKKEAVEKLCSSIFERKMIFKRNDDNDSICFRLNSDSIEKVNLIKQDLLNMTECPLDFRQNAHFKIVSKVNELMISILVVLAGLYQFAR